MIRKIVENQFDSQNKYVELACLSSDTKPTGGMVTGSLALEVDTGDIYAYDEIGAAWGKIAQLKNDEPAPATVSAPSLSMRPGLQTFQPDVIQPEGETEEGTEEVTEEEESDER